jgi:hypothetical protein
MNYVFRNAQPPVCPHGASPAIHISRRNGLGEFFLHRFLLISPDCVFDASLCQELVQNDLLIRKNLLTSFWRAYIGVRTETLAIPAFGTHILQAIRHRLAWPSKRAMS